jgi:fluoroacetyl-CoA thioesterase
VGADSVAERLIAPGVASKEAGVTTVGIRVELDHRVPSLVGAELEVEAVLERVAGRRLEFAVRLLGGGRLVASGYVTRVVVDTAAFLRDAGAGVAR